MAKGNKCMECGEVAYADTEEYQEKGTWVTYVCLNGTCPSVKKGYPWKERKFESNE